jgi:hypothetical protein
VEIPELVFTNQILPWLPTEEQSIAEMEAMDPATSSSNTVTVTAAVLPPIYEQQIKALVYQVVEEINAGTV